MGKLNTRIIVGLMLALFTLNGEAQETNSGITGSKQAHYFLTRSRVLRDRKDSVGAMDCLRLAHGKFVKMSDFKEAAEAVLNMEEYYQYFGGRDLNVRIKYYEWALTEFRRSSAKAREEATLKVLGDFYQIQGDLSKSLKYLLQALKLKDFIKAADQEALYDLLGSVYSALGNLNNGLRYGLDAVKICERLKDSSMQACAVYNRVGITYFRLKQFEEAQRYYKKSLTVASKLNDAETQIGLYINIAQVLFNEGNYQQCVSMLNGVKRRFPKAVAASPLSMDNSLLNCLIKLKRFQEGELYADRLNVLSHKVSMVGNDQQIIQTTLSNYYLATRKDALARKHLHILESVAEAQHSLFAMSTALSMAAKLDSLHHDYASAYRNYRKATEIQDSLWNIRQSRQVAQLHIQYEVERRDQEIKNQNERIRLLGSHTRLKQTTLQQERAMQWLIAGSTILLIFLLIISYRGYLIKRNLNKQLKIQRTEIDSQNDSLTSLINVKDALLAEKEWLMKEIHHRVKNNLQIVISLLSTQSKYLDNDIAYSAIRESQHRMQSISLIHQKLYQSENLALVDMNAYIRDLVFYLQDSFFTADRIIFSMEISSISLDVTRAVPLGLILNEAITNSIKYAFPDDRQGAISIGLRHLANNTTVLTIRDNGVGLPHTINIFKKKSLGMSLMRGLSKQISGELSIETGDGMTVNVEFNSDELLKAV
ncbi:hypothetical protein DYU05_06505 [Mucilaginibacter terrenus]|uniref:histidine kinase n=1 Tax=Mucilaginibacter terrenus TaxID=2482727 RepID=A0A3E2NW53_9SPHI|nr:tetratricopeptide repeat protein [Mucilaginibacter terrenus]RFZ85246.1 hypothetical protein DYU05_06505 [Mucilaginibacter terrenus]